MGKLLGVLSFTLLPSVLLAIDGNVTGNIMFALIQTSPIILSIGMFIYAIRKYLKEKRKIFFLLTIPFVLMLSYFLYKTNFIGLFRNTASMNFHERVFEYYPNELEAVGFSIIKDHTITDVLNKQIHYNLEACEDNTSHGISMWDKYYIYDNKKKIDIFFSSAAKDLHNDYSTCLFFLEYKNTVCSFWVKKNDGILHFDDGHQFNSCRRKESIFDL